MCVCVSVFGEYLLPEMGQIVDLATGNEATNTG